MCLLRIKPEHLKMSATESLDTRHLEQSPPLAADLLVGAEACRGNRPHGSASFLFRRKGRASRQENGSAPDRITLAPPRAFQQRARVIGVAHKRFRPLHRVMDRAGKDVSRSIPSNLPNTLEQGLRGEDLRDVRRIANAKLDAYRAQCWQQTDTPLAERSATRAQNKLGQKSRTYDTAQVTNPVYENEPARGPTAASSLLSTPETKLLRALRHCRL
jgi:hypothetical protein